MTHLKLPVAIFAVVTLLAACSSGAPHEVRRGKDSREEAGGLFTNKSKPTLRADLDLPPDLLASANEKVRENTGATGDAAGDGDENNSVTVGGNTSTTTAAEYEEVLPEIIGARIHTEAERSWLRVEAGPEVVWQKITEFWEAQEIDLVTRTPRAGFMETDWFAKTGKDGGGAAQLLAAFIASRTAVDKFTVRLERAESGASGGDVTNVYVSHRRRIRIGTEYANNERPNDYEWVEREADAERVAQLLQAIMLLFGENV